MRYTSEAIGEPMLAQHLGLVAQLRQWLTNATAEADERDITRECRNDRSAPGSRRASTASQTAR